MLYLRPSSRANHTNTVGFRHRISLSQNPKIMNPNRTVSHCMAFFCLSAGAQAFAATLEEIQVTATKTSQSVQDIPIAVSAFTPGRPLTMRDTELTTAATIVRRV